MGQIGGYTLILRALLTSVLIGGPPLYHTRPTEEDKYFFPLPPSRECIEKVEMVLNVPVAVDTFYDYLTGRCTHFNEQDAIHYFSLYVDLRMYDRACSQEAPDEDKLAMAEAIFGEYLDEEASAEFLVKLDPHVAMLFDSKYQNIE